MQAVPPTAPPTSGAPSLGDQVLEVSIISLCSLSIGGWMVPRAQTIRKRLCSSGAFGHPAQCGIWGALWVSHSLLELGDVTHVREPPHAGGRVASTGEALYDPSLRIRQAVTGGQLKNVLCFCRPERGAVPKRDCVGESAGRESMVVCQRV